MTAHSALYLSANTNNKLMLDFLIDTGSDVSIISPQVCSQLGLTDKLQSSNKEILNVNGEPIKCLGYGVLTLTLKGHELPLTVMVLDVVENAILGINFLQNYGIILDYGNSTLQFKHHKNKITCKCPRQVL